METASVPLVVVVCGGGGLCHATCCCVLEGVVIVLGTLGELATQDFLVLETVLV